MTEAANETWAQREQRLAEGKSSPSGWPIVRVKKPDDGLTIPEAVGVLRPCNLNVQRLIAVGSLTREA